MMYFKAYVAFLLVALTLLSQNGIRTAEGQLTSSPDYTKEQIQALIRETLGNRDYWTEILTKLTNSEFKKTPVLSRDEIAEFEKHVVRNINKIDDRIEALSREFGDFYDDDEPLLG